MAKNDKDRLIGRSNSQTLLRRSGLFRKTGGFFTAGLMCLEDYGAGVGSTSNATLRTTAGYMEGPMPLGGKDICGTAVPQTVLL